MHHFSRRIALRGLALLAAGATPAMRSRAFAAEKEPLAIRGYDPVAYFTIGRPVTGLPEIEYEWDEYRYHFASVEHRELFKADPARYAPQFANFCAMSLTRGNLVEANPEYWLISEGRLYIFARSVGPDLFQQDLFENVAKAHQNRALILKR